jgi:hypothetical protein
LNARTLFTEPDDLMAAELAGDLSHVITMTTLSPLDIAAHIDGPLRHYKHARHGGVFQHRFHLTGLTPGDARRVTDRLAALSDVAGVQVEHLIRRL